MSTRSKATSPPSAARVQASKALRLVQEKGAYASAAIQSCIDDTDMTDEDKRFAGALTLGVVQTQGVLDGILDGLLDKPRGIRPDTRRALQIAAFEILFLGKEPQHAVDQGVKLVGKSAPYARGIANAVLRQVADQQAAFPFGNPAQDMATLCRQEGFPWELACALCEERGEARTRALVAGVRTRPPVFAHLTSLKADPTATLARLAKAHIPIHIIEDIPGCIQLAQSKDVGAPAVMGLIEEGALIVSDLAAQLVAWWCVKDSLPVSLLEVGAGRGTKTVLIQSMAHTLYGRQIAEYACVDNVRFKRDALLERAHIYGAHVSRCITADGRSLASVLSDERFSTVFLDAPCSGLGTLRRHPEITWKVSHADIDALASLQSQMLASASERVEPEGSLVYATCTITQAEDEAVVEGFLGSDAGAPFRWVSGFATVADGAGADSHFLAMLARSS